MKHLLMIALFLISTTTYAKVQAEQNHARKSHERHIGSVSSKKHAKAKHSKTKKHGKKHSKKHRS